MTTEPTTLQTAQTEPLAAPDDAEVIAAAEQAEQDATGEHIVAYGCRGAGRVFLAGVPGRREKGYTLTIPTCPGCGASHEVKAMPRPRKPTDEIAISVDAPADPAPVKGAPRPAPKSDADVLAAIPEAWTSVAGVAEKLGYTNRGSFTNRLREMRDRGAGIETRSAYRGAPMHVRRAVKS